MPPMTSTTAMIHKMVAMSFSSLGNQLCLRTTSSAAVHTAEARAVNADLIPTGFPRPTEGSAGVLREGLLDTVQDAFEGSRRTSRNPGTQVGMCHSPT